MKKILSIALLALTFTSCKKDETTEPTPTTTTTSAIPADGWKLNGNTYKQVYCLRSESSGHLNCVDGTSGTIHAFAAYFKNLPTTSGTYRIVALVPNSSGHRPGYNIGDNEIIVIGTMPGTSGNISYYSTGAENKDATVTVTGGKIKIEVPEVDVTDATVTYKLTGTMVEN